MCTHIFTCLYIFAHLPRADRWGRSAGGADFAYRNCTRMPVVCLTKTCRLSTFICVVCCCMSALTVSVCSVVSLLVQYLLDEHIVIVVFTIRLKQQSFIAHVWHGFLLMWLANGEREREREREKERETEREIEIEIDRERDRDRDRERERKRERECLLACLSACLSAFGAGSKQS